MKIFLLFSISLSLFLSGIICIRVIVDPNFKIELNYIYLIGILFFAGILGDQLSVILEKVISDKIDKHITPEFIIGTVAFKNALEKITNEKVSPIIAKINLELNVNKNEVIEENEMLPEDITKYDTVIVPATWSMEENIKYKFYFCQKDRSFINATYIALYGSKKIRFVGKAKKLSQNELDDKLKNLEFNKWITKIIEIIPDVNYADFYDISEKSKELSISHEKPTAFTRKQVYSNYQMLINPNNKTTDKLV